MRIVIDTNIGCAAHSNSKDTTSIYCSKIMDSLYLNKHKIVITKDILTEYAKYFDISIFPCSQEIEEILTSTDQCVQSSDIRKKRLMTSWLAHMARLKLIHPISPASNCCKIRVKLMRCVKSIYERRPDEECQNYWKKIDKDIRWIEAGILADHIVISLDRRIKRDIKQICASRPTEEEMVASLKPLLWIDPRKDDETGSESILQWINDQCNASCVNREWCILN